MIDIGQLATNLELGDNGIWFSKELARISYPAEGNDAFFALEDRSFWFKHRNECIVKAMRIFPPLGTVFDVGGGNGCVASALGSAGINTVLVEPGPSGVRNAAARGLSPIVCSTLENAGFKPKTIPAVGLFDVLEHIEDDHHFLTVVNKLLISDGRVYITVPAYSLLWSNADKDAGHHRRYTLSSLTSKLESADYVVEFSTYFFSTLAVPIFLFRSIPSCFQSREKNNLATTQNAHVNDNGLLNRLLIGSLNLELKLIGKKVLPFGASCLVVARR